MEPDGSEREEHALRAAVLAGDEEAWRVLYDRHFDSLFAYVHARTRGNALRAEEVVQDCWAVAVRRIRAFDPRTGAFGGWLRGIADRLLLNERRRWARRFRLRGDNGRHEPTEAPPPRLERAELVAAALTSLPDRYQDVLRAKYEERRSVAQIAGAWGTTDKAVESLLTRARQAFREAWNRLDSPEP